MYKITEGTIKKEKDHVYRVQFSRISKNKKNNGFVFKTKKKRINEIKKNKCTCHHYVNDDH